MEKDPSQNNHTHLANLLAYVFQAGNRDFEKEIYVIDQFINRYLPKETANHFFDDFLDALKSKPDLESVLVNVNKDYSDDYAGKLDLMMRIYELMGSDGLNDRESKLFDTVFRFLDIAGEDVDLIKSLLIDGYEYRYYRNIYRKITAGESENPRAFDLVYRGANLTVFQLLSKYYLINNKSEKLVYADENVVHHGKIIPLENTEHIFIDNQTICVEDLELIFSLKQRQVHAKLFFSYKNGRLYKVKRFSEADLKLDIEKNILRLYQNPASRLHVQVGSAEIDDFTFVNLSDEVVLDNSFRTPARKLISRHVIKHLSLEQVQLGKDTIFISNICQSADFFIEDENEKEINITVKKEKVEDDTRFTLIAEDVHSSVLLNDRKIRKNEEIEIGRDSKLRVGKHQIMFDSATGTLSSSPVHFDSFKVAGLTYRFKGGEIATDNVSFETHSGDLTAIMGESGAGKSTLFQLLLGYLNPDSGKVLVNGLDIHEHIDKLRHHIGFVPQDDLLLENLSVYANMYYAAKIRMPDKPRKDIEDIIDNVLKDLELTDKKDLRVGSPIQKVLSGGERKRLNIGIELLFDPDLFFLDEPTSGLSSKESEMVINLLSKIANRGKIVFAIIHHPGSNIYKKFDKLILLDIGGKLAYFGDCLDAISYFKRFLPLKDNFIECPSCGNVDPEMIFHVLGEKELGRDGLPVYAPAEDHKKSSKTFLRNPFRSFENVKLPKRKYEPSYWERLFIAHRAEKIDLEQHVEDKPVPQPIEPPSHHTKRILYRLKVLYSLFQRSFHEKISDTANLIMTFIVPIVLGLVAGVLLRGGGEPYMLYANEQFPKYLFLSMIIFVFFGLISSVYEIIRDRPILIREKNADIRPWQYLVSKTLSFSLFAVFQVFIFVALGFWLLKIPAVPPAELKHIPAGNFFLYFVFLGFITTYASFSLGLLISSFLRSGFAAFNIIPLIIIPQIIFGGMFISYDNMFKVFKEHVPVYADLVFSRWAYEAALSGSEWFNPIYCATDINHILKHKRRLEQKNIGWDFDDLVDRPLRKLKARVIGSIPERISYNEFAGRIEKELAETHPELKERLLRYYFPDQNEKYYILSKEITTPGINKVKDIFSLVPPHGYRTVYLRYEVNEAVHDKIAGARTGEWITKLKTRSEGKLTSWLMSENIFPAHEKVWGNFCFPTVWFNIVVLCLQGFLFNLITIWNFRRQ